VSFRFKTIDSGGFMKEKLSRKEKASISTVLIVTPLIVERLLAVIKKQMRGESLSKEDREHVAEAVDFMKGAENLAIELDLP